MLESYDPHKKTTSVEVVLPNLIGIIRSSETFGYLQDILALERHIRKLSIPKYLFENKLHFNLDIHACLEVKMHELVYRLICRLHNVYKSFMNFDHKIFPAVPVDKCGSRDIEVRFIGWKRHGSHHSCACAHCGVQNLLAAVIN